jgi:putative transposase
MILQLIAEAEAAGAASAKACAILGLSARTVERWRGGAEEDLRQGPNTEPANKLTADERQHLLATVNSPEFRDLSPNQVVPLLADDGVYLASESTMYRVLREEEQLHHRERSRVPSRRAPAEHVSSGPNQVWSWDITYLRSPVLGAFFYLYLVVDVWSRRIMAWEVHSAESPDLASQLIERTCRALDLDPSGLVLHSDNGGPMKGSTMLATLQRLGIEASFSRPHVSDDNPFSEALFRTLKYRPEYPTRPFASLEATSSWVELFVAWYNTIHLHSGIRFVTPDDRHFGREVDLLARRHEVYQRAQAARPERWSRDTRCWEPIADVYLNPETPAPSLSRLTPIRNEPGGLGAVAPSGAGQSPVRALKSATNGTLPKAPPPATRSSDTLAPSRAQPNLVQLFTPKDRNRRAS